MRISDWSSDVCSSDLVLLAAGEVARQQDVERIGGLEQQLAAEGVVVLVVVLVVGARAVAGAHVHPAVALALGGVHAERSRVTQGVVVAARHRSEEHTSELQSLMRTSYAVFCLKKQNIRILVTHLTMAEHTTEYHS